MIERLKAVWKDEDGPTAVEYGLMAALIAVVIIVAVKALGEKVKLTFETVDKGMP
jgi:pilus assembly protein Flp/PilA